MEANNQVLRADIEANNQVLRADIEALKKQGDQILAAIKESKS
jgi:hypothetical protein